MIILCHGVLTKAKLWLVISDNQLDLQQAIGNLKYAHE